MGIDDISEKKLIPDKIIQYTDTHKEDTISFILGILEKEFGITGVERPDIYNISNVYQKDNGNFWITLADGKIVGTIALKNYGNNRGCLKRLYVDSKLRGQGVGPKLLSRLLEFAREKGYKEIYLSTVEKMQRAISFYKREGFQEITSLPQDIPADSDTVFFKMDLKYSN